MSVTSATTKERILEAAEEIMLAKSFHSVGLAEILASVKVPKGSFYHYFQSKEQFGVELLQHYVNEASEWKRKLLLTTDQEPNPFLRLMSFLDLAAAHLLEKECQCACLVSKLASEVATFSDPMRAVLADGIREWRGIFEQVIAEGQAKGVIRTNLNAAETAGLISDLWMGASQRCLVDRNVAPVRSAAKFIRNYLSPV
jgi:TetR/AcrR family transcriptional regulator, transcriptional repressor for nem operon